MLKNTDTCLGCGSHLQNENPNQVGYTINLEKPFCMSCYRLMHYGDAKAHHHPDQLPDFEANSLVVVVTSVLYLDTILNSDIKRLGDHQKVVYLINQIDLLPQSTSKNYLLGKIQKNFRLFRVLYDEIILMSAKNPLDIENLKDYLKHTKFKNIYLIGLQNSGKTTIFKELTGNKEALTMPKAALTQSILKGSFENKLIFDTPGLYQSGYLHEFLPYDTYKDILPKQEFKPRNGYMKLNDAIIIGGLVAISVIKGETKSTLFVRDEVKHHLTKDEKVLSVLNNEAIFDIKMDQYITEDFKLKDDVKYQFTLADFGLIQFMGPVTLRIYRHPKMYVSLSEGFFR
ncbi:GTPase YqeH [Acholeplasma oculi]|uniref:GTP-binding protein n=1 Tax=Acholeplasma oculi TaxID=35623 RepID=A0A061AB70_9MOLU|nr:GTPase [Acholeplasma oculi]CDR31098.1 GTP-binding protein [Acholeplasma oculi]SKC37020.1 hypothetical protein SAMN02745122_0456 [Acholeplasma oculi]SUT90779.1 GTPase YqeH [Acholeplasma oculi]